MNDTERPEFIKHYAEIQGEDNACYPKSDELLCITSDFGRKLGLKRMGVALDVLPPGRRSSWPHAHSHQEEFVYVVSGEPTAWVNGRTYALKPGDGVAFPPGTGIAHTMINDTDQEVRLLVVGEQSNPDDKGFYPLHPRRNAEIPYLWVDAPKHELGPHNGEPRK
ncbi:MAG: cupin domain-containing protein [Deltaproteobacteria bacterium]|nr:cupin domain-containing protein [Deltaproteobacteria bacterium]MBI3294370.1 cupin domain-containing protein [Deltaproteobacteria bacterium]